MGKRDGQDYHIESFLTGSSAATDPLRIALNFKILKRQILKRKKRTQFEISRKSKDISK
jgi:hypothetical protein